MHLDLYIYIHIHKNMILLEGASPVELDQNWISSSFNLAVSENLRTPNGEWNPSYSLMIWRWLSTKLLHFHLRISIWLLPLSLTCSKPLPNSQLWVSCEVSKHCGEVFGKGRSQDGSCTSDSDEKAWVAQGCYLQNNVSHRLYALMHVTTLPRYS